MIPGKSTPDSFNHPCVPGNRPWVVFSFHGFASGDSIMDAFTDAIAKNSRIHLQPNVAIG
jgi:hypothetical protein